MTTIKFRYAKAPVRLDFEPTRRFVEPDHTVHLPVPRVIRSDVASFAEDDIVPSRADFCYKVTESSAMGGRVAYVAVPDSVTPVWFDELQLVDPNTLDPMQEPLAAWWAFGNMLEARVVVLETGAAGVPTGVGYVHSQTAASTVWDVEHGLNGYPAGIVVLGSDGNQYEPDVTYLTANTLRLSLPTTLTGIAYLS